ncbi:protein archease-like [Parasteatoda tepidariorum]|uniref:protein archease-like n=1 Tax=Parasteatoda tepidariorum TaxID=114398 RepID=UPI00077F84CF|nr:protein archease-like [Parasteatoda tepidariorum]
MAEAGDADDIDDGFDPDPPIQDFSDEELQIPEVKYEYLDHPADVQLHSWGSTIEEAFEQIAVSMFGYMTEIETVDITMSQDIEAEGHDMLSLLFHFLDEFLYIFSAEPYFIARKVKILSFDRANFKVRARGYGEIFDLDKHPQGTEVKAITYSNMQVHENEGKTELFVIIDI